MLQTKKGGKMVLIGFTGIRLSEVICTAATKAEITMTKKDGSLMIFDRKTGVQTNARDAKYANKIVTVEDAPPAKEKKAPKKKAKKAAPVVEEVAEEDDFEDEEVEETPKKKTPAKKKASKKTAKVEELVEEEFEDEDDEEYEEV